MQVLRRPVHDARPLLQPATPDRPAALARADYIMRRYHAPPAEAERAVQTMDIPAQVLLEIEMAEHRRVAWTVEHDPFGVM